MNLHAETYRITSLAPDGPGLFVSVVSSAGKAGWLVLDKPLFFLEGIATDVRAILTWYKTAAYPQLTATRDDSLEGVIDEARFFDAGR